MAQEWAVGPQCDLEAMLAGVRDTLDKSSYTLRADDSFAAGETTDTDPFAEHNCELPNMVCYGL